MVGAVVVWKGTLGVCPKCRSWLTPGRGTPRDFQKCWRSDWVFLGAVEQSSVMEPPAIGTHFRVACRRSNVGFQWQPKLLEMMAGRNPGRNRTGRLHHSFDAVIGLDFSRQTKTSQRTNRFVVKTKSRQSRHRMSVSAWSICSQVRPPIISRASAQTGPTPWEPVDTPGLWSIVNGASTETCSNRTQEEPKSLSPTLGKKFAAGYRAGCQPKDRAVRHTP